MSGGTNCALAIAAMIDALENGAPANPVFFTGPNCDVAQYPAPGSIFPPHLFNSQAFNARQYFCKNSRGKPASVEGVDDTAYPKTQCPVPVVQSMILPPDISVEFFTPDAAYLTSRIFDMGYKKLQIGETKGTTKSEKDSLNELIKNNIVNFTTAPIRWGSRNSLSDQCLQSKLTNTNGFYDENTNKMLKSSLSCGVRFLPAFTCVVPTRPNELATIDEGKSWQACGFQNGGYCNTIGPNDTTTPDDGPRDAINRYGVTGGALSVAWRGVPGPWSQAQFEKIKGLSDPNYSASDCVARFDELYFFEEDSVSRINENRCISYEPRDAYRCETSHQVNGTVQNMRMSYTENSWENNVFAYCSGQRKLILGGIQVQRYTMGSPVCDDVMTRLCTNDAFVSTTPNATKVCACIIESRRLQYQYAGMDLPVQCFSQLCSRDSPMVYRTASQQAGCSAKLCQQILDVHGSDISRKGQQEVVCNDQFYDLNDPSKPPEDAEVIVPKPTPASPIDTTFFVSLGILLVMVFLIVVYFVRNYIVSHRQAKTQESKLEEALLRV